MTSQTIHAVTHKKYSPKIVCRKPTKEDNDASLLAMENCLFDRLMDDVMQDQSQAMYAFFDRHVHHFSNFCDNAQPLHNSVTDSSSTPPRLNERTNEPSNTLQMTTKSAVPLLI
jgi:hypothetical protein